ncbi:MAG: hypothetical protein AB7I38_08535 [Dehalococcoidia bacterium]
MPQGLNRYLLPAAGLLITFAVSGAIVFAVASFFLSGDDDDPSDRAAAVEVTPTQTLAAAPTPTATLTPSAAATPSSTPPVPIPTATPTPAPTPAVTPAPTLAPTEPPRPAPTQAVPAQPALASFAGTWRIADTVLQGRGAGQTFTFQVAIAQAGNSISGGAPGALTLSGTVAGNIATVAFTQPGLGITGIFIWTLGADGNATGTFTSNVPNSGTSQLIRIP